MEEVTHLYSLLIFELGKSNIFDAIAFTLLLRHIAKKHKHLKELIYREENEKYIDNKRDMWVQLNFTTASGSYVSSED